MLFKKKRVTLLVIPEEGSKTFEYKIARYVFVLGGVALLAMMVLLGFGARAGDQAPQLLVEVVQQVRGGNGRQVRLGPGQVQDRLRLQPFQALLFQKVQRRGRFGRTSKLRPPERRPAVGAVDDAGRRVGRGQDLGQVAEAVRGGQRPLGQFQRRRSVGFLVVGR